MKCPFCKLELPEDSLFCQYCGKEIDFDLVAAQEQEDANSAVVANNVSTPIIDNHVFCTKCGMKFEGAFCPVCGQPAVVKTEEFNAAVARINQTAMHIPVSTTKSATAPLEAKHLSANTAAISKTPKERKPLGKKQWLISGCALIGVVLLFFTGCYFYSLNQMDKCNFDTAEKWFNCIPAGDMLFPNASKYIGVGKHVTSQSYDSAINVLSNISDYRNASAVKDKVASLKIDKMISNNKYSDAILYLNSNISNIDNASALINKTYYKWSNYYESNQQYLQAYKKMEQAKGYLDADSKLFDLKEAAYQQAITQYKSGNYISPVAAFKEFGSYKSCPLYLALIDARTQGITDYNYYLLINSLNFEDVKTALLSTTETAQMFLEGTWKGDGYYFKMKENGDISYDIPWFSYGDYYIVLNGDFIMVKNVTVSEAAKAAVEGTTLNNQKTLFSISVISEDCIEVRAHKNNKTYTLYRQ